MTENRKVDFSTKFDLLKKYPRASFTAFFSILLPLLFFIPVWLVQYNNDKDIPEVDYKSIENYGDKTIGKIESIEVDYNTTINGKNPCEITYTYQIKDTLVQSKTKTLDNIAELEVGDNVSVTYLNSKSILDNYKPYKFPSWIFIIPFIFSWIIGFPFIIYLVYKLNNEIKLYKDGVKRDAEIVAMIPNSGISFFNIGQTVQIHYQIQSSNGRMVLSKSETNDLSILSNKKKGEFISVLVSKSNVRKSCIYPEIAALKNNWKL